ncbi:MAG: TonB-dependent receptor [Ignavibacteriaceae bacterium]|jgi:iron complex outermembrane receptor protein|nr:MAG: hypothetical protein EDM69_03390 [Chlorobiota bacterium]KXK05809.1 MAG: Outer membrane receptor protein [Chlorobi bacterium OLB4]MBV6398360.1 Vitamin B12 transporter BtuB [Ignavibacteria bacterium]MCC6886049.1 TonB-dependent receptor [Ignavibacteriales bacterium]MCE7952700.1 hypothetical protein [Chlorobi bacterium CHB7]MDL1886811.1 hypothetical protein [Ignavibacteria bacterium CHB1]MEB2330279.1 TonB-dependent receptor [Ignavibacteriaceae bacterium]OQY77841.1 MAG: hypothetical prote
MKRTLLAFLISSFLFSPALFSQTDDESVPPGDSVIYETDEVVITGTRTYKRIIDIPYSVVRIDQSQYKFDRRSAVQDVLGSVPGLFLQSRYGNHDTRISIRGFGSRSNTGIRGVRILLDGIPESEPDGQTRIEAIDFYSIGSIEVVKGNSSSLYTNAPGGVINFINDITFPRTFLSTFNYFGSFDLRENGLKAGIRSDKYAFLGTYKYHHFKGYREHSEDFWHVLNMVLESNPGDNSRLTLLGYFADGLIRLPGSLTKEQFDQNPLQPNPRDVSRDAKRISRKGRVALRFNKYLDEDEKNEIEFTAYGTIKYFERTAATYRIMNRYGLGATGRWINKSVLFGQDNEFSIGGDYFYQSGPIENYQNLNGKRSDNLLYLTDETIGNTGFYYQNYFNLIPGKLDFLATGRYDRVLFDQKNMLLEVQSRQRVFDAFTPKFALNYKFTPYIAAYTSYGFSFDAPAGNEMDNYPLSSDPVGLLNPDLKSQSSKNFELGIKGNLVYRGTKFFNNLLFEATFFKSVIDDEIVPFEVLGEVYFRNAAKTNRLGFELGLGTEIYNGLRFKSAYTYSHFVYDEYIARTIEYDSNSNLVFIDRDFAGNFAPSVPEHNFAASLSYDYPVSEGITIFLKGGVNGVSGLWVDDQNTAKTDGYFLVNTIVGLDIVKGNFNLMFNGGLYNVFDKSYVGFVNINSARKEFYEAGEPRNYFAGLNIGYTFR